MGYTLSHTTNAAMQTGSDRDWFEAFDAEDAADATPAPPTRGRPPRGPTLDEIIAPLFVARHSPFGSLEAMLDASRLPARNAEDVSATLESGAWDAFVAQYSDFPSWAAMRGAAGRDWVRRRLRGH